MTNLIIKKARLASLKNGEYYLFCKSVLKQADELVKDKQIEVYNSQKAALVKAFEQVESGYNCSRKCPETPKLHEAEMESRRTYNTFKHAVSTNAKSHRSDKKQKAGGILSVVGGKNLSTEADDYIGFIHKAVTEIESRYMDNVEALRLDGLFEDMKIANEEAIQYQQQRDAYLAAKVKMDDARKTFETEYQKFILALEYHTLFVDGDTFKPLIGYRNSAILTVSAPFLTVFFSALTAYGIHVYDFKLKEVSYTVILLIMMVPTQVTATGFLNFMAKIGLTDTYWPLILPAAAAPAIVFFMRSYMKSSFPLDIVEAARIDGSGEFRTFLTIAIPMMKPAIAVQAIFAFVANWNNFYTPSMILLSSKTNQKTLPMMIASIQASDKTSDLGVVYTCIALSIVPIIIAYVLLSRFIIAGVALGGVKE